MNRMLTIVDYIVSIYLGMLSIVDYMVYPDKPLNSRDAEYSR